MKKILVGLLVCLALANAKLSVPIESSGDVKITDITPNVTTIGENTKVSIKGEGFKESSVVSIIPDTLNENLILKTVDYFSNVIDVDVIAEEKKAVVLDIDLGLVLVNLSDPLDPKKITNYPLQNVTNKSKVEIKDNHIILYETAPICQDKLFTNFISH
ncbi:MAG: hypothetical protein JXQ66_06540 [Campylobacterales bacterium]|nr:hypothetical protein [Campylobacterales bacterium]